jgi:hypothetical protein
VNRQPHDPSLKAQARQVYEAHGSRKAAEATGISRRTINAWARADGWQPPGNRPHLRVAPVPQTRQPTPKGQVASLGYAPMRRVLLRQLADEARACLGALARDREAGKSGAARNWAWCVGILLERAELVAKAAGSDLAGDRPDDAEVVARLQEMATDLAGRRTGSDDQPP